MVRKHKFGVKIAHKNFYPNLGYLP